MDPTQGSKSYWKVSLKNQHIPSLEQIVQIQILKKVGTPWLYYLSLPLPPRPTILSSWAFKRKASKCKLLGAHGTDPKPPWSRAPEEQGINRGNRKTRSQQTRPLPKKHDPLCILERFQPISSTRITQSKPVGSFKPYPGSGMRRRFCILEHIFPPLSV